MAKRDDPSSFDVQSGLKTDYILIATGVGAALLATAGAAALLGRGRLRKAAPPVPEEAAGSVKTDVEVIKERARR